MSMLETLNLVASLFGTFHTHQTHRAAMQHDQELHVRGVAASTEHHYQQLIAELLAAAKEADRDVWEQRNGQFNNLMLSAILMFGVAMSAIIEGNFDKQDSELLTLCFATFEACALSLLFLCLVCCLLVSRRMSIYMIKRAARFVDRLGEIISSADELASHAGNVGLLPAEEITGLSVSNRRRPPLGDTDADRGHRCSAHGAAAARLESMKDGQNEFQRQLMRALETTAGGAAARQAARRKTLSRVLQAQPSKRTRAISTGSVAESAADSIGEAADGVGESADAEGSAVEPLLGSTAIPSHAAPANWPVPPTTRPPSTTRPKPPPPPPMPTGAARRGFGNPVPRGRQLGSSARRLEFNVGVSRRASSVDGDSDEDPVSRRERAETFHEFWMRSCARMSRVAFNAFYFGTACVWGAVIVFFVASFDEVHLSTTIVFVGICGAGLFTSLLFFWEMINVRVYMGEHGGEHPRRSPPWVGSPVSSPGATGMREAEQELSLWERRMQQRLVGLPRKIHRIHEAEHEL